MIYKVDIREVSLLAEKIDIISNFLSETFQDMKLKYGKNMSDFIRGTELDEGETIEDIEIVKD